MVFQASQDERQALGTCSVQNAFPASCMKPAEMCPPSQAPGCSPCPPPRPSRTRPEPHSAIGSGADKQQRALQPRPRAAGRRRPALAPRRGRQRVPHRADAGDDLCGGAAGAARGHELRQVWLRHRGEDAGEGEDVVGVAAQRAAADERLHVPHADQVVAPAAAGQKGRGWRWAGLWGGLPAATRPPAPSQGCSTHLQLRPPCPSHRRLPTPHSPPTPAPEHNAGPAVQRQHAAAVTSQHPHKLQAAGPPHAHSAVCSSPKGSRMHRVRGVVLLRGQPGPRSGMGTQASSAWLSKRTCSTGRQRAAHRWRRRRRRARRPPGR